jgi:hypothetical protein
MDAGMLPPMPPSARTLIFWNCETCVSLVALLVFVFGAFAFFLVGMVALYDNAIKFFIKLVRVGARKKYRVWPVEHKASKGPPNLFIEENEFFPYRPHFLYISWFVAREMADRLADC